MKTLNVTKMHALGNNYVYINCFETDLTEAELPRLARAISDVRYGIGSDGLILIGPSTKASAQMRIFNADGSEAENCGNGLRCVAKYVYERGIVQTRQFALETRTGVIDAEVHLKDGRVEQVTVDMGAPVFGAAAVHYIGDWEPASASADVETSAGTYQGTLVSMGNPHFVIFCEDAAHAPLTAAGPEIERNPLFAERVNVEWVSPRSRAELDFRVWERGSGVTFACGTGACAAVAAGIRRGDLNADVQVHLAGGDLWITQQDGHMLMRGEAVEVMRGAFDWRD